MENSKRELVLTIAFIILAVIFTSLLPGYVDATEVAICCMMGVEEPWPVGMLLFVPTYLIGGECYRTLRYFIVKKPERRGYRTVLNGVSLGVTVLFFGKASLKSFGYSIFKWHMVINDFYFDETPYWLIAFAAIYVLYGICSLIFRKKKTN